MQLRTQKKVYIKERKKREKGGIHKKKREMKGRIMINDSPHIAIS